MIVNNLCKTINGKVILDKISFTLNDESKVGLIGRNGIGKTTLLRILSGNLSYDSGKININNKTIKMLKQEISKDDYNYSIINYIKKENDILNLEKRLHELEENLNDSNMEEYGEILNTYLNMDGYNLENNLISVLNNLNLNVDINKKVGTLSGGEKIKILLASILLSNSDILLLDEPTNNLDVQAIKWLENYLIKLDKQMIIVSHDEEFLNNVTNKIFELDNGKITEYNLKYYDYLNYKNIEYTKALTEYEQLKQERKKLKEEIEETKAWINKGLSSKKKDNDKLSANYAKERTKNTSSKISKLKDELENMEEIYFKKKEPINFSINYSDIKGKGNIYIENLICGYEDFETPIINLFIPFGTRIEIYGKNGSGKTTLIKTLLNEILPKSGNIYIGKDVKIGYIFQDTQNGNLINSTISEYLLQDNSIDKSMLYNILSKFNIPYIDKDKPYMLLSPGERTRVNLAKLALNKTNILILDEATNHLDIEAIHVLEEVVDTFNGTIISVSHNRAFNNHLKPDIIFNIEDGTLTYTDEKTKKIK